MKWEVKNIFLQIINATKDNLALWDFSDNIVDIVAGRNQICGIVNVTRKVKCMGVNVANK